MAVPFFAPTPFLANLRGATDRDRNQRRLEMDCAKLQRVLKRRAVAGAR